MVPLSYDPRSCSQKRQARRILHDLLPLMCPHPPPLPPRPPPPRSRTYPSVYDSRDGASEPAPSPSPPSSLTHAHRCIGYRNPNWHSLPKSARLTYLSVYDSRDRASEPALFSPPPSSLTHVHSIQTPTRIFSSALALLSELKQRQNFCSPWRVQRNAVHARRVDPSVLTFSLSLHRRPHNWIPPEQCVPTPSPSDNRHSQCLFPQDDMNKGLSVSKKWEFVSKGTELNREICI